MLEGSHMDGTATDRLALPVSASAFAAVNADFSDEAEVDNILDTWEEMRPDAGTSSHHAAKGFGSDNDDDEEQTGVTALRRAPLRKEIPIIFRRSLLIIVRDRTYMQAWRRCWNVLHPTHILSGSFCFLMCHTQRSCTPVAPSSFS
jgi:hypothetical protein